MAMSSFSADKVKQSGSYVLLKDYSFRVIDAEIIESLDDLFVINCSCYFEGFKNEPLLAKSSDAVLGSDALFCLNDPNKIKDKEKSISVKDVMNRKNNASSHVSDKIYHGIISGLTYKGNSYSDGKDTSSSSKTLKRRHYYKFTITSPLYKMSLNKSYRIYTDINVLDVIKQTVSRYSGFLGKETDFSNIFNSYPESEYICQYDESDLSFMKRLCHNNGIFFYEDDNNIYFYDSIYHTSSSFDKSGLKDSGSIGLSKYPFNINPNNKLSNYCIYDIQKDFNLNPRQVLSSSVNTGNPLSEVSEKSVDYFNGEEKDSNSSQYLDALQTVHKNFLNHSFTGDAAFSQSLKLNANLTFLSRQFHSSCFHAKSNIPDLKLNDILEISNLDGDLYFGSYKNDGNRYKITGIDHVLKDNSELGSVVGSGDNIGSYYENVLTLIPKDIPFVPYPISKPIVNGCSLGVVCGENKNVDNEKNTIYTDDYGRVKVRFGYNIIQGGIDNKVSSSSNNDYSHTCFLRCVMPISSSGSGFVAIPRVGDEVIIGFLEGDCDKPIIMGSLYNSYNPSLIQGGIKQNYHQTSISSRTVGVSESGLNEITLSNLPNQEKVYLKAEKDYTEVIQNDFSQTVSNNKVSNVKGGYVENIALAHVQNIGLAKNVNVGAEYVTVVATSKDTMVGLSNTLNVGVSNKLNVGIDSDEVVGKNKKVEVGGNFSETIVGNSKTMITGDTSQTIQGALTSTAIKEIKMSTEGDYALNTKKAATIECEDAISIKSKKKTAFENDSMEVKSKSHFKVEADDQVNFKVGNTTVTAKSDSVIIKAGGVEVVINAQGLKVKGGEIDAE